MEVVGPVQHLPGDRIDVAADVERAADASSDSSSEEEFITDIPEEPTNTSEPIPVLQPTSESNPVPALIQPQKTLPGMTQTSLLAEEKSHTLTLYLPRSSMGRRTRSGLDAKIWGRTSTKMSLYGREYSKK